jgi:predicted O-methyltransferase YrrM
MNSLTDAIHRLFASAGQTKIESRRMFDYDRGRLVNPVLAAAEAKSHDIDSAMAATGLSVGYPAWNLLYYSLLCSLPVAKPVVVETGTNAGFSTIVLAQALEDGGVEGVVRTVDLDADVVVIARANVAEAGLSHRVDFAVGDSLGFLGALTTQQDHIDFAFLDGSHERDHVVAEFEIIHRRVSAGRGKVYFDNVSSGGVAEALDVIHKRYGGSLVWFDNCSWSPPGNAIWQPS